MIKVKKIKVHNKKIICNTYHRNAIKDIIKNGLQIVILRATKKKKG
jgi:hypothetical protein